MVDRFPDHLVKIREILVEILAALDEWYKFIECMASFDILSIIYAILT